MQPRREGRRRSRRKFVCLSDLPGAAQSQDSERKRLVNIQEQALVAMVTGQQGAEVR